MKVRALSNCIIWRTDVIKRNGDGKIVLDAIGLINLSMKIVVLVVGLVAYFFGVIQPMQTQNALLEFRMQALETASVQRELKDVKLGEMIQQIRELLITHIAVDTLSRGTAGHP